MALQPQLVRNSDDQLRIDASFPNGRYTFSVRPEAQQLIETLGYTPRDSLPWFLFKSLAAVGDVWLPNTSESIVDDLAIPDAPTSMDTDEATALADHLRGRRLGTAEREQMAEIISSSALSGYLSVDDFDSKSEWVTETSSLLSEGNAETATDKQTEDQAFDHGVSSSILHIGKTTLGRKNMGRAARESDFFDAFSQAIGIAIEREVDGVVHTGRLFQSGAADRELISELQTELKRLQDEGIPFYLVCGKKELELQPALESLATSGLLTMIGGRTVDVGSALTLVGLDASSDRIEASLDGHSEETALVVPCAGRDLTEPTNEAIQTILEGLPTRPLALLAGTQDSPVHEKSGGTHFLDPGSVEHILSKSTIEEHPPVCVVNEYSITPDGMDITSHELETRLFSTFEFEITETTTLSSIRSELTAYNLEQRAVLAILTGSSTANEELTRKQIQSLLSDQAFCARVYDERSSPTDEGGTQAEKDTQESDGPAAPTLEELLETVKQSRTAQSAGIAELETTTLADSYAVLSEAKSRLDDIRVAVRDELRSRIDRNESVTGDIGRVRGATTRRRSVRDTATVRDVLSKHDIPMDRITTEAIDSDELAGLVEGDSVDISEPDVFEITESEFIQRLELDLAGDLEPANQERDGEQTDEESFRTHKVYLGDGAPIGGWTPVEKSVVEDEIVPLVRTHSGSSDDQTISVNFSKDVSISGWNHVDASVVKEQLVPLVEKHRMS